MKKRFSQSINQERRKLVMDYIREKYSLEVLLRNLNVWNDGALVIKCPFHSDSRPSFNIDLDANQYKCFSCGRGGGYLSFYHNYHSIVDEDNKNFNEHVEELLTNDDQMQEELGFSTIFVKVETNVSLEELSKFSYEKYAPVRIDTKSLIKIRKKLMSDTNRLLDFFSDVEKGISLNELWQKYYLDLKYDNVILDDNVKQGIQSEFDDLLSDLGIEDDITGQTNLFGDDSNE
jgi:DNA-directed RNA polymerase subunit N (RpoN/RPB10)